MEKQQLIFITGGARSGKSAFAEHYAIALAGQNNGKLHYIATSKPSDEEMKSRIRHHKEQRENSGAIWKTRECPVDLPAISSLFQHDDVVLLDCLTLLLTNELFHDNNWQDSRKQNKAVHSILTGIETIRKNAKAILIISNEVLNEPMPDQRLVKIYGRLLGYLHQKIVKIACEAYVVEAGIPVLMKGPER